jgi:hypothetical protein
VDELGFLSIVRVVVVDPHSPASDRAELERIRNSLSDEDVLLATSTCGTLFFDPKDWRDFLMRHLQRDFEAAWKRRNLGAQG